MSKTKWMVIATIAAISGAVTWKERKAIAETLERWTHYRDR